MANELSKEALLEKAESLIKKSEAAILSSVGENGYPRTAAMSNIKTEGIKTVWFASGTDSYKTKNFKRDSKSSVCYHTDSDNITLIGDVEIVDDMEIKKQLWVDWFIKHFPLGVTDPNYCILKFEANYIQIYIEDNFEEFNIE